MQIQLIASPPAALRQLIRTTDSHKGLYGSVAILGSAALLAGRAALHLGAGKVWLGLLNRSISVDPLQPELMIVESSQLLAKYAPSHLLIGLGLGQKPAARALLASCLNSSCRSSLMLMA